MALTGEFIATDLTLEYEEPGTSTTYNDISQYVNEVKFGRKVGVADTTSYGTKDKTSVPGLGEHEVSFMLRFNNTPAVAARPQTKLKVMFDNHTATTWRVRELGAGNGLPEQTFTAYITQFDEEKSNDDTVVGATVKLTISGAVTEATQA